MNLFWIQIQQKNLPDVQNRHIYSKTMPWNSKNADLCIVQNRKECILSQNLTFLLFINYLACLKQKPSFLIITNTIALYKTNKLYVHELNMKPDTLTLQADLWMITEPNAVYTE